MRTFLLIVALLGGILVVFSAPVIAIMGAWEAMEGRLARRAPRVTGGDLRRRRLPRSRIVLHGQTMAPEGRPLLAPLSGNECAWYRLVLLRTDEWRAEEGTRWELKIVWSEESASHVRIHDGIRPVDVAVSLLDRQLTGYQDRVVRRSDAREELDNTGRAREPQPVINDLMARRILPAHVVRPRGTTTGFTLVEDVVEERAWITAVGRARHRRARVTLVPGAGPVYGVTRATPAGMVAHFRRGRGALVAVGTTVVIGLLLLLCAYGGVWLVDGHPPARGGA